MIEAAHEIGVKLPAYISAGLDEKMVNSHTDWLRRTADGGTTWVGWMEAGFHEFCFRSPYLDYLVEQTERWSETTMLTDIPGHRRRPRLLLPALPERDAPRGMDPRKVEDRRKLGRETYLNYTRRINETIRAREAGDDDFPQLRHITRGDRELAAANTHLELESLPTGGMDTTISPSPRAIPRGSTPISSA